MSKDLKKQILETEIPDSQLALFYLGQVGFIIKFRGQYLLLDGYLTGGMYDPEKGWGRYYLPPIKPEELSFIDAVFCSHDHLDHTDPATIAGILSVNDHAKFVIPAAYAQKTVEQYGIPKERLIPAHAGEKLSFLPDISVLPVPSAHEELHRDERGDYFEMGYVLDFSGIRVYHSGDCCLYEGQKELVGEVDVAMLPVNGRSFYRYNRDIIGNMTLEEAVIFAKEAAVSLFVPLHFDMFPGNTIPAGYIPEAIREYAPGMPYKIFQPGERMIFMK